MKQKRGDGHAAGRTLRVRWLVGAVAALIAIGAAVVLVLAPGRERSASELAAFGKLDPGRVVRAHTLAGDQLLAGPVLLDHRAVWAEAGIHRLLIRSLDADGQARTIFSSSSALGTPKGAQWPFSVSSIAAGDGRVAFIEQAMPCASSPPGNPRCAPTLGPMTLPDSVRLFAGRPGAVRPVETAVGPHCRKTPEPLAVAVASAGLVVDEGPNLCPRRAVRVVLRSFTGRLLRVLAQGANIGPPLAAAGNWAAFMRGLNRLQIVRVATGRTVLRLRQSFISDIALDHSGAFALLTNGPAEPCQSSHRRVLSFARLSVGRVGRPGLRVAAERADWGLSATSTAIAIAGGHVAFVRPTGHCLAVAQPAIGERGRIPRPLRGLQFRSTVRLNGRLIADGVDNHPLAFDGRFVATAHSNVVQLARIG